MLVEERKAISCVAFNGGIGTLEQLGNLGRRRLTRVYSYSTDRVKRIRGKEAGPDLRVAMEVTGTLNTAASRLLTRRFARPRGICLGRVTRHVRRCPISGHVVTYRKFGTCLSSLRGFDKVWG